MVFEKCARSRGHQQRQAKKQRYVESNSFEDGPPNSGPLAAPPASTMPPPPTQHVMTVSNVCHARQRIQNSQGEIKQDQDPAELSEHEIRVRSLIWNFLDPELINEVQPIARTQNPPPAPNPSPGATDKRKRGRCSSPMANAADTSNAAAASGKAYRSGPTAPKRRRLRNTTTCTSSLTRNVPLGN